MARLTGLNLSVFTVNSADQLVTAQSATLNTDIDTTDASLVNAAAVVNEDGRYGYSLEWDAVGDTTVLPALITLAKAATTVAWAATTGATGASVYSGSGFIEDLEITWDGPNIIKARAVLRGQGALVIA